MKRLLLIIPALLSSMFGFSQGITFEHGTWKEVLEKAQQINKPIFLEFFITGSDSCKQVAESIFSLESVGKVYNKKFICFQIDAEKGEGAEMAKQYEVTSYPTYIFFNADGTPFCKSFNVVSAKNFIRLSDKAFDIKYNSKTMNDMEKEYTEKKDDPVFLKYYMIKRSGLGLSNNFLFDKYLTLIPEEDRISEIVLDLYYIEGKNLRINSVAYENLQKNNKKINDVLGNVNFLLFNGIKNTISDAAMTKDEQSLTTAMSAYDQLPKQDMPMQKDELYMMYYEKTGETDNYMRYIASYCNNYLLKISDATIEEKNMESVQIVEDLIKSGALPIANTALITKTRNEAARTENNRIGNELNRLSLVAFDKTSDQKVLKNALKWSKRSMEILPDKAQFIDTNAKILYKLGKVKDALAMEEEAMNKTPKGDIFLNRIEETIYKMKAGEKLWKD